MKTKVGGNQSIEKLCTLIEASGPAPDHLRKQTETKKRTILLFILLPRDREPFVFVSR